MTPNDKTRFVQAIGAMAATFRQEATEMVFTGYRLGLEDLSIEAIEHAATRAIRECKFMPTVSELRDLAGHMRPEDRAVLAWDAAVRAVSTHGYTKSVNFDDRVINATIRSLGGWDEFNLRAESNDAKWLRKDFERIYTSFCRNGISREAAMSLPGFHDRNNAGAFPEAVKPAALIATGMPAHRPGVVPAIAQELPTAKQIEYTKGIGEVPDDSEPTA